jgi:hypothetical protein
MKQMRKQLFIGIISIFLLVLMLSGCQNNIGKATAIKTVRASSCDLDKQCETQSLTAESASRIGTVVIDGKSITTKAGSTSALLLTSDIKSVIVNGILTAGIINGKTISTPAGSTSALELTSDTKEVVVDGILSAGSVVINGKTISTIEGSTSALELTSAVKSVIVDGILSTPTLRASVIDADSGKFRDAQFNTVGISEEVIIGNKMQAQKAVILDSAQVMALKGTGNAYACLDAEGKLFRSTKPCQ